jgi:uncharacterized damage-inducible protein DinB
MDNILLMYARYTQRANAEVIALLDKLSVGELNEDRKSYYKSLSGLMSHTLGGTAYFFGLFRSAAPVAAKAIKEAEGLSCPEGDTLSSAQWSELKRVAAICDKGMIDFIEAASEAELSAPVKIDWYGGKPDAVPLAFLLHCYFVHGTHHRGQISQVLDSMGIEHDFSGLDLEFFPK